MPYGTQIYLCHHSHRTSTRCSYHEEQPRQLRKLQEEHWKPLVQWSKEHVGLDVKLFDSILIGKQPEESKTKLLAVLNQFDQWRMAGELVPLTSATTFADIALQKGMKELYTPPRVH
jgi:ATP synthase mitochondrial F1 complex assembly factor 2